MKRVLITLAALLFGLIGLGMSLCGGGVLVIGIVNAVRTQSTGLVGIIGIAVPSIVLGVAIVVGCVNLIKKADED